jgi:hypothetical protein
LALVSRRPVVALLLATLCFLVAAPASALADAQLTISPTKADLSIPAGGRAVVQVLLSADGDEPLDLTYRHVDFGLTDSYQVTLIEDSAPETTAFSTRAWFSTPKVRYHVPAGQQVTVPVTVAVPKNTPAGTYLGIPAFTNAPAQGGGQVQNAFGTGPLLFITVQGGSAPKLDITRLDVPGLVQHGPITPALRVTNTGDGFFSVTGSVRIDGRRSDEATIGQQYVLPDQPRTIHRDSNSAGTGAHGNRLTVGSTSLGLGRHTLQVRLRINPTNVTVVESRTFWVVPAWAWVVGILLALAVLGGLTMLVTWLVGRRARATARALPVATPVSPVDAEAGEFDEVLGIELDADAIPEHERPDVDIDAGIDPMYDGFEYGDEAELQLGGDEADGDDGDEPSTQPR